MCHDKVLLKNPKYQKHFGKVRKVFSYKCMNGHHI